MILFNNAQLGSGGPVDSETPVTANTNDTGFQNTLSDALASTLQDFGIDPNSVTVSIDPAGAGSTQTAASTDTSADASADSGIVSPFSKAAAEAYTEAFHNPPASSTAAPAAATGGPTVTATGNPATLANTGTNGATGSGGSTGSTGSTGSSGESQQAYDDAYWSAQPAAVQALQNIDDLGARSLAAGQLASEGYTIDVPIMVWGWDPAKTMAARESYGYSWVPSAMQASVQEAPGIKLPGLTDYDPTKPPAGSIAV